MRKQWECHSVLKANAFRRCEAEVFQEAERFISAGPTQKENHLCDTVCPFVCCNTPSFLTEPQSANCVVALQSGASLTIMLREGQSKHRTYTVIHPRRALVHTPSTRSQNTGDYLSAIPEGLAFPRKS